MSPVPGHSDGKSGAPIQRCGIRELSGSTVAVARRAGSPWPEQMARKMLRNVEIRGVHAARNGPSEHRKCWQRVELGTQWTEQMSRKMLRNVEKRGIQAARNGPSPPPTPAGARWPSRSLARRIALVQGNARQRPPTLRHQCQLVEDPLPLELNRRLVVKSRLLRFLQPSMPPLDPRKFSS